MFGLTTLGLLHTAVSLVALGAAAVALGRAKRLSASQVEGKIYVAGTLIAAGSALGIFRHGGFGPGHALAILTLGAIGGALFFGSRGHRVGEAVCYGLSLLFHFIPGVTEALVRLPIGAPYAASAEDPRLQPVHLGLVLVAAVGMTLQVRWLRRAA